MNRYMAAILVLSSTTMIVLSLFPLIHGQQEGWYEIRDGAVRIVSGPDVLRHVGQEDGREVYNVTGNLAGTVRIFDSDLIVQGATGDVEVSGQIEIWAGEVNVTVRDLTFRGGRAAVSLNRGTGCIVTRCTFLDDAAVASQQATEFVISDNTFVSKGFEYVNGMITGERSEEETGFPAMKITSSWVEEGMRPNVICNNVIVGYSTGINFQWVFRTLVSGNNITKTKKQAIWLFNSALLVISGNTITKNGHTNEQGALEGDPDGILFQSSSLNLIVGNVIGGDPEHPEDVSYRNLRDGIEIQCQASENNTVWNNTIWGNTHQDYAGYGLRLTTYFCKLHNTTVVNNNFMGDSRYVYSRDSLNTWDAGYGNLDLSDEQLQVVLGWASRAQGWAGALGELASSAVPFLLDDLERSLGSIRGGNYWEGQCSADEKSGPGQDMDGSDGICDQPYTEIRNVTDRYPLTAYYELRPPKDRDGVPDWIEALVPTPSGGTGDGNGDDVPDSEQEDVASLPLHEGAERRGYATLVASPGQLLNVRTLPAPDDPPLGAEFPHGMFSFEVWGVDNGATVTIEVWVPYDGSSYELWKKDVGGEWAKIPVTVSYEPAGLPAATRVTFSLDEGGPFDHDGLSNGRLVDDAGLVAIPECLAAALLAIVLGVSTSIGRGHLAGNNRR